MSRYIDVNMLIKKYIDTDIKKFSNSDAKIVLENLKQNILKAPTIEPKRGEWKWISSTFDRTPCRMTYMCSCCRHEVITFDVEPWEHYCPQCGAKMDGEREGE